LQLAFGHENIVALKDAAGDVAETAHVIAQAPEGFEVYSGDDGLNLPLASVGAVGAISVASHWAGPQMRAMFDAIQAGNLELARTINQWLIPSWKFETGETTPNPMPTRAMMQYLLGREIGDCRLPNMPVTKDLLFKAERVWTDLQEVAAA
jgi:4-hydroxy-tetrahydrodipicolinate synthase